MQSNECFYVIIINQDGLPLTYYIVSGRKHIKFCKIVEA